MAIYYVDPADTGTDSGTLANPWVDEQDFWDIAVGGDICYAKGTQTQTVTIATAGAGDADDPIYFVGVNDSWVEDGTPFVRDGNSAAANNFSYGHSYIVMRNTKNINATSNALVDSAAIVGIYQYNCEWSDSGSSGMSLGSISRSLFVNIRANGNASRGAYFATDAVTLINPEFNDNDTNGFYVASRLVVVNGVVHNNGGYGIDVASGGRLTLSKCVIDGNDNDGIRSASTYFLSLLECMLTNNGGYGLNNTGSFQSKLYACSYFNNTSGETNGNVAQILNETLSADPYANLASDNFVRDDLASPDVYRATNIGGYGATTIPYLTTGLQPQPASGGGGARRNRPQIFGRG